MADGAAGSSTRPTIVVGVDQSPGSARALTWAARRALEVPGPSLLAVHVLTYNREFLRDISADTLTTWRRALASDLNGPWTNAARAAGAPVNTRLVEDDSVAGGLLKVADEVSAELIVLGTSGRGGVAGRLLGATTYVVTHRAHTPVVIIPVDWPTTES